MKFYNFYKEALCSSPSGQGVVQVDPFAGFIPGKMFVPAALLLEKPGRDLIETGGVGRMDVLRADRVRLPFVVDAFDVSHETPPPCHAEATRMPGASLANLQRHGSPKTNQSSATQPHDQPTSRPREAGHFELGRPKGDELGRSPHPRSFAGLRPARPRQEKRRRRRRPRGSVEDPHPRPPSSGFERAEDRAFDGQPTEGETPHEERAQVPDDPQQPLGRGAHCVRSVDVSLLGE